MSDVWGPSLLVIGLGNPDCADDGIGPLVAQQLADGRLGRAKVIVRTGDTLALLDDWAEADAVVLIDAAALISQPGVIHRIDLTMEALPRELSLSSTHAFGLADALALARTLDRLPQHVIIYAIEGGCFEPGVIMTPAVAEAADQVVANITSDAKRVMQSE
jgi:hydrogenase maturation protease